jgi:hypothetical protein
MVDVNPKKSHFFFDFICRAIWQVGQGYLDCEGLCPSPLKKTIVLCQNDFFFLIFLLHNVFLFMGTHAFSSMGINFKFLFFLKTTYNHKVVT